MSRPPTIPAEKKLRIVLSVLQGEISIAEAARREKVSEQAIGNWKRQFLEGGKAGIEAGKSKPSTREQQLEDEVAELTQTLGEAASTTRFCQLIDMPERTWRRWQAKARAGAIGYLPFDADTANLFFQLIANRYEQGSILVTSNMPFGRWGEIFSDDIVAAAMIDRLVHHAEVLTLAGDSYRTRTRRELLKTPPTPGADH